MRKILKTKGRNNKVFYSKLAYLIFSVLVLLTFASCTKQEPERYSRHAKYCKCKDELDGQELHFETPDEKPELILDEILTITGVSLRPFKLCKTKQIDKYAGYAGYINEMPYIIYDQENMDWAEVNNPVYPYFLMAHELGHQLSHYVIDGSNFYGHGRELEADTFAGFILYKLGFSLEDSMDAKSESIEATEKHPSGIERRKAIKEGWLQAERVANNITPPRNI